MKKYLNLLIKKWKDIFIFGLVAVMVYGVYTIKPIDQKARLVGKQLSPVPAKPVPNACSKTEIEYILKNDDNLLNSKDFMVLDMSTFKLVKTKIKGGKEYKYYKRYGQKDIYITIASEITGTTK